MAPARRAALVALVSLVTAAGCSKDSQQKQLDERTRARPDDAGAGDAGASSPAASARRFDDLGAAVKAIIAGDEPRVIGFGEVHQLRGSKAYSALARFTDSALPVLADSGAAHMVLETWAERPECGEAQKAVDTQVRKDTQRPEATQSELSRLLAAAAERDIGRHGMAMACDEYRALVGDAGTVDYARLLSLITEKLGALTIEAVRRSPSGARVFVYGGALHNDLYPNPGTAGWSYVERLQQVLGKTGYVEVDIYVPELIESDEVLKSEPWFSLLGDARLDRGVLLVRRGERSYVILARRGIARGEPPAVPQPKRAEPGN